MALEDPVAAYNAENNMEALLVQRYLESEGLETHVTEDNSPVGCWMFGTLPEIHKPQVWISRRDVDRAAALLTEYERRKAAHDAERAARATSKIEVHCEECGKTSEFAGSLEGSVQNCPHCNAYVDVGEFDWPDDEVADASDSTDTDG
ncbi:MAG: putative signal transducing protein [Planctomycetota bacterium]